MGYFLGLLVVIVVVLWAFIIASLGMLVGLTFWPVFIIVLCIGIVFIIYKAARA